MYARSFPSLRSQSGRFRLRQKARQVSITSRPPAPPSTLHSDEILRLSTLERQVHDLQVRMERLDHSLMLIATAALAHPCSSSFSFACMILVAAHHLLLSQIICISFACLACIGWWKALFEHPGCPVTVFSLNMDMVETTTVGELSKLALDDLTPLPCI